MRKLQGPLNVALRLVLCLALAAPQMLAMPMALADAPQEIIVEPPITEAAGAPALQDSGEAIQDAGDVLVDPPAPEPAVTDAPIITEAPIATDAPAAIDTPPPAETPLPADVPPTDAPLVTPLPDADPGSYVRQSDAPMDVRSVLTGMGYPEDSMLNQLSIAFTEDGERVESPTEAAEVALTFHLHLPEGVPAQLRQDDWYVIAMPDTVAVSGAHIISLSDSDAGIEYARIEVESGPLRVKFTDAVRSLSTLNDTVTIAATFVPGAYAPGEAVTLALPNEEAPPVTFTMAAEDGGIPAEQGTTPEEEAIQEEAEAILQMPEEGTPQALSGQQLVTGFQLAYADASGVPTDAPDISAAISGTLTLSVPEALKAQLTEGTTYTIALPDALSIHEEQAAEIPFADGVTAFAHIGTDGRIVLTFGAGMEALASPVGTLTFAAAFDPAVVSAPGALVLSIPEEALAPAVEVTLLPDAMDIMALDAAWTRTDDAPMNVKDIMGNLGIAPQSILTDIHLEYQEPGGGETSTTEATVDAAISFNMNLHIPQALAENMREGDTYTVDLPSEIRVDQGGSYELYQPGSGGPSYATATVGTDGRVTFLFHNDIRTLGESDGELHFSASFNKDAIDTGGDHEIKIPNEPDDLSVTVNIISQLTQEVSKSGTADRPYNPSAITWSVDFNKPLKTLSGATLTDAIPDGLELTGTQVYTIQVDLGGNVIPGSEVPLDPSAYSVDADGAVHFLTDISDAIRVVYQTAITGGTDDGGDLNFINNATLTADGIDSLQASATVTARYGKLLDKVNTKYDPATQTFTWQIRYNYGQQAIDAADATLTDALSGAGMVFDPGSITVQRVAIDESGTPSVAGEMGEGSDYTVAIDGTQMVIAFPQGLSDAVLITYTTHIDGIVDESGVEYSNDVTTTWGGSSHATGAHKPTEQQNIIKSVFKVDDVNQQVIWTTTINRARYHMVNWSMTDTLGDGQHFINLEDLAIVDITGGGTGSLALGTDYEVDTITDQQITVRFLGDYAAGTDHEFQIVYYSGYDDSDLQTLINRATGSWTDDQGDPHSSTVTVNHPRTPIDIDGGSKFGAYNAVTKEITWAILVNYHHYEFESAVLTDPIKGNQQYVHNSLQIYAAQTGTASDLSGPPISPGALGLTVDEPSDANGQTLTISAPGSEQAGTGSYWATFRTTLSDQIVNPGSTYANDATLMANGHSHNLHGDVSIAHGGELLSKNGQQSSDGYVHWTAVINPSQSTLEDATLTDTPSDNQRIDMSSLVFYRTVVDQAGNITANTRAPLTGGQYAATYAENESGTWVLTVTFPGTLSSAVVMQYRTSVFLTEQTGTVTNSIHLEGTNGGESHDGDTQSQIPVRVYEGGGTIYGKQGALTIRKLGVDGQILPGAVLQLEDAKGNRIGPVTVGPSGEVTFSGIVQGAYKLYELSAPDGYTISDALASGMDVIVDDATTAGTSVVEVRNEQTRASLRKVDERGGPVSGAVFRVEMQDAGGAYQPVGTGTFTSGPDGMIIANGLLPGQYRFVEVMAPDGYIRNTQVREFTLVAGQDGVITPQDTGDFANYRGAASLVKTDESGEPLMGAVFTLTASDGTLVGTYATDSMGRVQITGLAPGAYTLVETVAPVGYALVSDPRAFTIPDEAEGAVPPVPIGTVVNPVAVGSVILRKADGDTSTGLSGAVFSLTDEGGQELLQVTTNAYGQAQIDDLLPGDYTLTEIAAPDGYIRNTSPWTFTVPDDVGTRTSVIDIGAYENTQGRARITKTDESGQTLAGAVFTLYAPDGSAIGTYTTDVNGVLELYRLEPGTYRLVETQAPKGFALTSDPISFTIPEAVAGELPTLNIGTAINERQVGVAIIRKVDEATGTILAGATFELLNRDTLQVIARVTTGTDGTASVANLPSGHYQFVEVQAPAGYALNTAPLPFDIFDGTQTSPIEVTSRDARLPNYPTPTPSPWPTVPPWGPPQTGDTGDGPWTALLAISAAILLAATGALIITRRRTKRN